MNQLKLQLSSFIRKSFLSINTQIFLVTLLISLGVGSNIHNKVRAEANLDVPEELSEVIEKIEKAANEQNLDRVLKYYDPNFSNDDGLTVEGVESALAKVWATYPQISYETTIDSWAEEEGDLVAETTTKIIGTQSDRGRTIKLESHLKSKQYFRDRKLIKQEILAEETTVTTGDRPPLVEINAPESVKLGEKYYFDTIVTEPLEDDVLLGAALEEKTASNLYLNPSSIELEPLPAGGIYKVVTAPRLSDNHWLSAIIVRGDGITMVTRRVRVEE